MGSICGGLCDAVWLYVLMVVEKMKKEEEGEDMEERGEEEEGKGLGEGREE